MKNNNFLLNSLLHSQISQRTEPDQKKHQFLAAMRLNLQGQVSTEVLAEMTEVITPLLENNQFETATEILTFWLTTEEEREKTLHKITNNERTLHTEMFSNHFHFFSSTWGIVLFLEKLITPKQLDRISRHFPTNLLLTSSAIFVLRNDRALSEKISKISDITAFKNLCSQNTLLALRNNTYTFEELTALPSGEHVKSVVSPHAQKAYRDHLFTLEDIKTIPDDNVFNPIKHLLNEWGIELLRKNFITWDNIKQIDNIIWMRHVCTEWGLKAFEKKHISAKDLENLNLCSSLHALLIEGAITTYDKGYFTPQQAISKLNNDQIFTLTSQNGLKALEEGVITFDKVVELNIHSTVLDKIVSPYGRNIVRSTSLKDVVDLPSFYQEAILNKHGEKLITKFFVPISAIKKLPTREHAEFAASKTALDLYENDISHLTRLIPGAR